MHALNLSNDEVMSFLTQVYTATGFTCDPSAAFVIFDGFNFDIKAVSQGKEPLTPAQIESVSSFLFQRFMGRPLLLDATEFELNKQAEEFAMTLRNTLRAGGWGARLFPVNP